MQNNKQFRIALFLVLTLLLGVIFGMYSYVYKGSVKKEPLESTQSTQQTQSIFLGDYSCKNKSCFEESFKLCEPAGFLRETPNVRIVYKVTGKVDNGCGIYMKYLENPKQEFSGKEMYCTIDNYTNFGSNFGLAISSIINRIKAEETLSCTGDLYEALRMNTL